ncbi:MAG: hypothetical protein A2Z34_05970 [Planctomycetes bacterium RBG_16_59_8]|nr:MAG: hypothetical protein A2Z34_05970 [Planctomycetes bacterium RBG_16_59_8]
MPRHFRKTALLLIALAFLCSCSPSSRRGGEKRADPPRRAGEEYDEAIHRGPPMKELMLLSVMPFFSNVEYIEGITPMERTEGKLFFSVNNVSAYGMSDLSVKAVLVVDESAVVLPSMETIITVNGTKGVPKAVEGLGSAGKLTVLEPETMVLKSGDHFAVDAHGHGQFSIQCVIPRGVRRGEKLFFVVVIGDDAGRRLIVRSDPVTVDLLRKDWGR